MHWFIAACLQVCIQQQCDRFHSYNLATSRNGTSFKLWILGHRKTKSLNRISKSHSGTRSKNNPASFWTVAIYKYQVMESIFGAIKFDSILLGNSKGNSFTQLNYLLAGSLEYLQKAYEQIIGKWNSLPDFMYDNLSTITLKRKWFIMSF